MDYIASVSAVLRLTPEEILWNLSYARGLQAQMVHFIRSGVEVRSA